MTMSKTHDREPLNHEGGRGAGRAAPTTDLATGAWRSSGLIPTLYAPFALLSVLVMTLGKSTNSVLDELDHFPSVTFVQLCSGAFALIGCGDQVFYALMVHGITEWALMVGLVLEQLPTNKKIDEAMVDEEQNGQHSKVYQGHFINGGDENDFKDFKEHCVNFSCFVFYVDEKSSSVQICEICKTNEPVCVTEEAKDNPKLAELKDRLIEAYPRLFSGVAKKSFPDGGNFDMAKIKLKPNPKIYRHRAYQLKGEQGEAMKRLLMEVIERGWIEPCDSECASPACIVSKKEKQKGEWRLVVDYVGLNQQTEHDPYSLPLIDSIVKKQQKKRIFMVLDLKHGYHQIPLHEDSEPCTAMSTPLRPMQWMAVPIGAKNGNAAIQRMMEDVV